MFPIEQTLAQFIEALLIGKSVVVNSRGEWAIESRGKKLLRLFSGREAARLVALAHSFCAILDSLEAVPVQFSASSLSSTQRRDFKTYLRAAEAILARLSTEKAPFAVSASQMLKMRIISLQYRLESFNGGINAQAPRSDLQNALRRYAEEWKGSLEVVNEKELTEEQLSAIEAMSRFPAFAEIVVGDEAARLDFFKWSLRDKGPVSLFVEYPALRRRLVSCGLSGRIGRMGGARVLKIFKRNIARDLMEKVVSLPFEGRDVNILDGAEEVEFRGGYKLTIDSVFEVFRDKALRVGRLEFMHDGIINWNVQNWGWWNAEKSKYEVVDLTKDGWWKELPFFEVLTLQEAADRYGSDANGERWVAAATATRGKASLDVDLTHAYLEVAVPIDGKSYGIFDFGKQAIDFPETYLETLAMICKTVHATIAYPDENVYYTHREHVLHPFSLTPTEGAKLMNAIKKDMISSRGLNFVYQIESENCAKWVHEKLEFSLGFHAVPNLFVMSIFQTEPSSFLRAVINFCKIFPENWQVRALTFLHLPLGAAKGHWVLEHGRLIWRALTHHHFWQTGIIYLPSFLHKQKEAGHLDIAEIFVSEEEGEAPYQKGRNKNWVGDCISSIQGGQILRIATSLLASRRYGSSRIRKAFQIFTGELRLRQECFFSPGIEFARVIRLMI